MKKGPNDIDKLARDAFEGWEEAPSPQMLGQIQRKMFFFNISRRRIITGFFISVFLVSAGMFLWLSPSSEPAQANHTLYMPHSINTEFNHVVVADNQFDKSDITNSTSNTPPPALNTNQNHPVKQNSIKQTTLNNSTNSTKNTSPNNFNNSTISDTQASTTKALNQLFQNPVQPDKVVVPINSGAKLSFTKNVLFSDLTKIPSLLSKKIEINYTPSLFSEERSSKKSVIPHTLWSVAVYSETGINKTSELLSSGEQTQINKISFDPALSYSGGLAAEMQRGRFVMTTGIQYSCLNSNNNSDALLFNPLDITEYNPNGQILVFDTIGGYYHYTIVCDSMIHIIDSTWEWNLQENYITQYDTLNYIRYDTLKNARWKESRRLIEIPLYAGYGFRVGRFDCNVQSGVIFGFYTGSKTHSQNFEGNVADMFPANVLKENQMQLSWMVSASASWWLNEKFSIFAAPYFRKNITPLYNNDNTKYGYTLGGLRAGIKIKL
ncbi:MAG: hypothetical protein V2A54_01910 [Bacteroidota bacterium]